MTRSPVVTVKASTVGEATSPADAGVRSSNRHASRTR